MIYTINQGLVKDKISKFNMLLIATAFAVVATLSVFASAGAEGAATPSTNDANRGNGWAHFNVLETRAGEVDVEFVSTRPFFSCFEYRSDGAATTDPRDNFNEEITDGLWPFVCVKDQTKIQTLTADEYVEIRMVFGAEKKERFDWTRVNVLADAQTKNDCKKDGFAALGFKNQGLCIQFVNTGRDSR